MNKLVRRGGKAAFQNLKVNTKDLRCMDCGGFALDGGSIFFGAFKVENGRALLGAICELCTLHRLERRGNFVNAGSSDCFQVELPRLGLKRQKLNIPWGKNES
jgi:hypothetical protein